MEGKATWDPDPPRPVSSGQDRQPWSASLGDMGISALRTPDFHQGDVGDEHRCSFKLHYTEGELYTESLQ